MTVSPAEFLLVLKGGGTPEMRQRVQEQAADPASELHGWLKGVEKWSQTAFGRPPVSEKIIRFRMAGFSQPTGGAGVSMSDALMVLQGIASAELVARVQEAAQDPDSAIGRFMRSASESGRDSGESP